MRCNDLNQEVSEVSATGFTHLADAFVSSVQRFGVCTAWCYEDTSYTYQALDQHSDRLALALRRRGVCAGDRVGFFLKPCVELVPVVLAIVKAGATYVPLEEQMGLEQRSFKIQDAGIQLVITNMPESIMGGNTQFLDVTGWLDQDFDVENVQPTQPAAVCHQPCPLYICYTSGSTGVPKGVMVTHESVLALAQERDYLPLSSDDRVGQAANPAFDAFTFELWATLLNGACLVSVPKSVYVSPLALADYVVEQRLTTLFLTTAVFNQCAQDLPQMFQGMRNVLFGGELANVHSVDRVLKAGGPARLLHVYGPTEATTFSTWHRLDGRLEGEEHVPIGKGLAYTRCHVMDNTLMPTPNGVLGELLLGGTGLATGYLHRPALTAAAFVPDPTSTQPGERLYRTGDLVVEAEGSRLLLFVGRWDQQIKIRGFRIELGEVEAHLASVEGVQACTVGVRELASGERYIAAWYVGEPDSLALRARLETVLPSRMVPAAFVRMEHLPLNANGKIDRRQLPDPGQDRYRQERPYRGPSTETEHQLHTIWTRLLENQELSIDDNLFRMGAHSLLFTAAGNRIEDLFELRLPLSTMFEFSNIEDLSRYIDILVTARGLFSQGPWPEDPEMITGWV